MSLYSLLYFLFFALAAFTPPLATPKHLAWGETARTTFLRSLDKMLSLFSEEESRSYIADPYAKKFEYVNKDPYFQNFIRVYGYFSEEHPIVSRLTTDYQDLLVAKEALIKIYEKIKDPVQLEITTAEVLTKVLAYRWLEVGEEIQIPVVDSSQTIELVTYKVDEIIDLWRGMPAFGLMPKDKKEGIPILLFRGTDLSFVTERGWASIISDLEIHDPGLATFQNGEPAIQWWLQKAEKRGTKARVMGVSLGGILTYYTVLMKSNLINSKIPSISFSPPGVSREILAEWNQLSKKPPLITFVCQGDAIPKYGRLMSDSFLLFNEEIPAPIAAHTQLITFLPSFFLQQINVAQENSSRKH